MPNLKSKKSRLLCELQGFYCWNPVFRHLEGWGSDCRIYAGEQASNVLEFSGKVEIINREGQHLFLPVKRKVENRQSQRRSQQSFRGHHLGGTCTLQQILGLTWPRESPLHSVSNKPRQDKPCKQPPIQADGKSHLPSGHHGHM